MATVVTVFIQKNGETQIEFNSIVNSL